MTLSVVGTQVRNRSKVRPFEKFEFEINFHLFFNSKFELIILDIIQHARREAVERRVCNYREV